ncbi:MAG: COG3014 family protein [Bacteroidota bacterium]
MHTTGLWVILNLLLLQSCHVAYYQKDAQFHKLFTASKWAQAEAQLAKDKRAERRKTRLLYYLNRGVVAHLMQQYAASNYFFEQAYFTCEDFLAKPLDEALALVLNPSVTDYKGEDHEVLLLHYYKVLNFLQLGQYQDALVECRRLNIRLNQLSDKRSKANQYKRDAFVHTLMGLVYQANHEYNDAFIAYRNAVEIYQEDYKRLFGLDVPEQLKKDLIYTAYKTGLHDQVAQYKRLFKLNYDPAQETLCGNAVFLWNNGLGPVKDAWRIDFVLKHGAGGAVTFSNKALGLSFPFTLPNNGNNEAIRALKLIRVTFPKYRERPLIYNQACVLTSDGRKQLFERLEDINAISFRVLRQRMVLELSKSLLRVALKKATEYQIRKQNKTLGTLVQGINFLTEKADTRSWQTIPHSVYYARLRLPEGVHQVAFQAYSGQLPCTTSQNQKFSLALRNGQTVFQIVNSPIAKSR